MEPYLEGQAQVPSVGISGRNTQRFVHCETKFHNKKESYFNLWLKFNICKSDYKNKTPTEKALIDFKLFQYNVCVPLY